MRIVNQDKTMILNFENIEVIGIGNPLENNDGKFKILVETTSDNQYPIAEYETEERAKEVLQEIVKQKAMFALFRTAPTGGKEQTEMLEKFAQKKIILDTYEMPKE